MKETKQCELMNKILDGEALSADELRLVKSWFEHDAAFVEEFWQQLKIQAILKTCRSVQKDRGTTGTASGLCASGMPVAGAPEYQGIFRVSTSPGAVRASGYAPRGIERITPPGAGVSAGRSRSESPTGAACPRHTAPGTPKKLTEN